MPETRPSYSTLALKNEVTDVKDSTILSASSEAALFRKGELLDPRRSRRWRSTSNAQQVITGQFASAVVPRQLVLVDSNLDTPAGNVEDALAALSVRLQLQGAYTNAAAVSAWANDGSAGQSFTQGTGANQPTYQNLQCDGKTVVRFDGTNDYLDLATPISLTNAHTIIMVVKLNDVAVGHRFLGGNTGTAARVSWVSGALYYYDDTNSVSVSWAPVANRWYCVRIVRNGTSVSFYVDGVQVGTTQVLASGTPIFTLRSVGRALNDTSNVLKGDLAEVMIATGASFESAGYGLACQDYAYSRFFDPSDTADGLTTMALSSLMLELGGTTSFSSNGIPRWTLQSYQQSSRRTLGWYTRRPDSYVTSSADARQTYTSDAVDIFLGTSFWRLTFPSGAVLDSDGDGVVDTYHELGNIWLGNYTELPIDFGISMQVMDPSFVSESDAGARFVDRLPSYHEVDFSSGANLEAVSYPLLQKIDEAGTTRHVLLDVWAPRTDKTLRSMGLYYGHFAKGSKMTRKIVGRDDFSTSFVESRA